MTDHRKMFPRVDLKMNWFQEPLRDHTDLDDKVSFALSGAAKPLPHHPNRNNVVREGEEMTAPLPRTAGSATTRLSMLSDG